MIEPLSDVVMMTERLRKDSAVCAFFAESEGPLILARAPGRLDVMGGVADYSGALVAEATIAEAALVALRQRPDAQIRFWSLGIERDGLAPHAQFSLNEFYQGDSLSDYASVRALLAHTPKTRWAAYLAGCFYVLLAEGILAQFEKGADVLLDSRVPLGAGVSSSAAIEVATMQAINTAYNLEMDGVIVARLAQIVENRVVGAPCGIMDQMTSALGIENSVLLILCQPHEIQGTQSWPEGVRIYGINSNVKHSVGGSAYTRARIAAFMGRKLLGVDFLANAKIRRTLPENTIRLPDEMSGKEFLRKYGETGDEVTAIDPQETYPIWAATQHAIDEHERVQNFVHLLSSDSDLVNLERAGRLMYQSHASYSRIGLGCAETDLLVQLAREAGHTHGIYGAKITGGGSGGTVALLTDGNGAEQSITQIAEQYQQRTGLVPQIFQAGLSPGALAFGHRKITLTQ